MSSFSILINFSSFKILVFIFGLKYLNPYVAIIMQKLPFQNEYNSIISNAIVGIGLFIALEFFTQITQILLKTSDQQNNIKEELQNFIQYALLLIISQLIFTGLLCFVVYKDVYNPFIKHWGVTASLAVSIIFIYHYQHRKMKLAKNQAN